MDKELADQELDALREELESFRMEKEKIRDVIGQIGGHGNKKQERIVNLSFIGLVVVFFIFDLVEHVAGWDIPGLPPSFLLSLAVLLVSAKIIWMIHRQAKVDHFQFWILNSIDFQMNMISRRLGAMEESLASAATDKADQPTPSVRT